VVANDRKRKRTILRLVSDQEVIVDVRGLQEHVYGFL
jgi:hypothetical protein